MFRKSSLNLLCASLLCSTSALAANHPLTAGLNIEYDFPTNRAEVFTNYTMFTINAVCSINTTDVNNILHVRGLRRSGEVNGRVINTNDEIDVVVGNGDKLYLSAKPAAQVEITNKGEHTVKATCKLA